MPDQLKRKWERWKQSLPTSVSIPRLIPEFKVCVQKINLQVFTDASKGGVFATVYFVVHQPKGISQGLLCLTLELSKQDLTIPRLELSTCRISVNLLRNTRKALAGYSVNKLVA